MNSLRFGVVTGVVVFLSFIVLLREIVIRKIPAPPANRAMEVKGEFMQEAVHQPVAWRPMGPDVFLSAKRSSKPILVAIGAPWNATARIMDSQMFSNWEIANLINQSFIPVRIDEMQQPPWASGILPLSRVDVVFQSGYQVYVLDSKARLVSYLDPPLTASGLDFSAIMDRLIAARDMADESLSSEDPPDLEVAQQNDLAQLAGGGTGQPLTLGNYAAALASKAKPQTGAFTVGGMPKLLPNAWLFQLRTGHIEDMRRSLDRLLLSPLCDVVHGGFYEVGLDPDELKVDFDKITWRNAEMAALLAEAGIRTGDPLYRYAARRTFDAIRMQMSMGDIFFACVPGDEDEWGRSRSGSFSSAQLREIFDSPQRAWVEDNLGLRPALNRQAVPYLVSRKVLNDPMLERILNKLEADAPLSSDPQEVLCLDVTAKSSACMIRCGRIWQDAARLQEALRSATGLDSFLHGADVMHQHTLGAPSGYLSDYLAFADAKLEVYLATGSDAAFRSGLSVLERAMSRFAGQEQGVWLTDAPQNEIPGNPNGNPPELLDEVRESCTAQAIRLFTAYGSMLRPGPESRMFLSAAATTVSHFERLNVADNPEMAGYYLSAAALQDPQCAFAVGPQRQELSKKLFQLRPNRLVAPASEAVRPDLMTRKSGIYVVSGSVVAGPYSLDEAAKLIPADLQIGEADGS